MKLLALDTTETACSAALWCDGVVSGRFELAPRRAGELILAQMDALLAEGGLALGQLDGLAFGRGPGAFTGLRIAAGVVQGAAFGADLPVAPVSSLRALAQGAYRTAGSGDVIAMFDARMEEVYWAACRLTADGVMALVTDEQVTRPGSVEVPQGRAWVGAGSGWDRYGDLLSGNMEAPVTALPGLQVDAIDVAALGARMLAAGEGVAPEFALPVYLRERVTG